MKVGLSRAVQNQPNYAVLASPFPSPHTSATRCASSTRPDWPDQDSASGFIATPPAARQKALKRSEQRMRAALKNAEVKLSFFRR